MPNHKLILFILIIVLVQSKILGRLDAIREATKGYTIEATPNDTASVLQQVIDSTKYNE
jgi:hypothetical protein